MALLTNSNLSNLPSSGGGSTSASDLTSGTLALARGGTGADLSATGGTGQFLKQSTSGGVVSVGAISASDLPNHSATLLTSGTLPAARYTSSPTTNNLLRYNGTALVDSALLDNGSKVSTDRYLQFAATSTPSTSEYGIGAHLTNGLYLQTPTGYGAIVKAGATYFGAISPDSGGLYHATNCPANYFDKGIILTTSTLTFAGSTATPTTSEFGFGVSTSNGINYQVPGGYLHRFFDGSTEGLRVGEGAGLGTVTAYGAFRIFNSVTPASASASGNAGTIHWDTSYIYVCVGANTWKRAALSTW